MPFTVYRRLLLLRLLRHQAVVQTAPALAQVQVRGTRDRARLAAAVAQIAPARGTHLTGARSQTIMLV